MKSFISIAAIILLLAGHAAKAQNQQRHFDQKLYNTILHMDSVCFNGFNNRDLEVMKKMFSKDVEFYNDNGTITNYDETIKAFGVMFSAPKENWLKRELIKSSLEVYPLKNFGAIEVGVHKFTHMENGKEQVALLKFTEVWQLKDGEWKMTRVISYNH
ncbi:MAG TPA: nuclear transport factor 2 family protein [Mucilaginibacter sp.]|jgi:hypothetical protein|nr:nuclear transport factor 2 family protein [Mucilaginibacter sp.]